MLEKKTNEMFLLSPGSLRADAQRDAPGYRKCGHLLSVSGAAASSLRATIKINNCINNIQTRNTNRMEVKQQ